MATPLYTFMKNRGTSIYVFPSASRDLNKRNNPNYKVNFSKFTLLNFPEQVVAQLDGEGQEDGIMNFSKFREGPRFYNFQPGSGTYPGPIPQLFSDQLIESLRNYVANQDEVIRTSKINVKDDFYNLSEKQTNSEKIFWKWVKKLNLISFEPALHKIDWDKNLQDFKNPNKPNATVLDYFDEYLWKERDINIYPILELKGISSNTAQITVDQIMKIKNGDKFIFDGSILESNSILTGVSYEVFDVQIFDGAKQTIFKVNQEDLSLRVFTITGLTCKLDYNRFVQYVGEISTESMIETSNKSYIEVTANIPHHAGKTPTVLFRINDTTNYYPSMELPILPEQIQEEILGSENLLSPIRQNPSNYPGSFYGYFDTVDKTYKTSNGDRLRKSGEYYGILKTNNIDISDENYIEKLTEFNADNIDGLNLDFDTDHYLKMNLPGSTLTNFDEFNSYKFNNQAPEDFEFNAILWYYTVDDGSGNIYSNLYGIEFLNNPNDDFDTNDAEGKKIRSFQKLVSNGEQDGLSYMYNLNISFKSDNDVVPMSYDPNTLYNNFGLDLYKNILQTNAQLQENLLYIISGFTYINDEILKVKSLVFSQQQYDVIQQRLENLDDLLKYYSTMKLADSTTTSVEIDYSGNYPLAKINVNQSEYKEILELTTSEIYDYNRQTSTPLVISIPTSNKLMLKIINDTTELLTEPIKIKLDTDLRYTQSMDIYVEPKLSDISNMLQVNIDYLTSTSETESELFNIKLPTDLKEYDAINVENSILTQNNYLTSNLVEYIKLIDTQSISGKTLILTTNPLFEESEVIYIDNFWLMDSNSENLTNYSGAYPIEAVGTLGDKQYYQIDLAPGAVNILKSTLKLSSYNGMKINILRVSESPDSTLTDRYRITKELL